MTCGWERKGLKRKDKRKLNTTEMRLSKVMLGATLKERSRNEEVRRRTTFRWWRQNKVNSVDKFMYWERMRMNQYVRRWKRLFSGIVVEEGGRRHGKTDRERERERKKVHPFWPGRSKWRGTHFVSCKNIVLSRLYRPLEFVGTTLQLSNINLIISIIFKHIVGKLFDSIGNLGCKIFACLTVEQQEQKKMLPLVYWPSFVCYLAVIFCVLMFL